MATAKLNPYRRTNLDKRFKGDDPTANPFVDKVAGVKGRDAVPDGKDPESLLGDELGELSLSKPVVKSGGIRAEPEEDDEELSTEEMLDDSDLPDGVTDKVVWLAAQKQAKKEGKADNEEYVLSLYEEMMETEALEEEVGMDLDGDEEKGESPAHVALVMKSKSEGEPPKKRKSFFNLMGAR